MALSNWSLGSLFEGTRLRPGESACARARKSCTMTRLKGGLSKKFLASYEKDNRLREQLETGRVTVLREIVAKKGCVEYGEVEAAP